MSDIYSKIADLAASGKQAALCIITETSGSTPRKAGSKMIVLEDKNIIGSIGGGNVEIKVIEDAVSVIGNGKPAKLSYDLEAGAEMVCGGKVEIYIEPVYPHKHLLVLGAGHVGGAVARFASSLGFRLSIIDDRPEIINKLNIENAELICGDYLASVRDFRFSENTFIVITTPSHAYDEELTAYCAKQPHAYLGMIGSKKKVEKARLRFKEEFSLSEEEINNIDMPIGIKFNAQTPEEIAVSIIAKLIDVKNKING